MFNYSKLKQLLFILLMASLAGCAITNSLQGVPATVKDEPKWTYESRVKYFEAFKRYEQMGRSDSAKIWLVHYLKDICAVNPDALYQLILLSRQEYPKQQELSCVKDRVSVSKSVDNYWILYLAYSGYKKMYLDEAKYYAEIARTKEDGIRALGLAYAAQATGAASNKEVNDFSVSLSHNFSEREYHNIIQNAALFTYNINPNEYSSKWFGCKDNLCDLTDLQKASLAKLDDEVTQARADYLAEQERIRIAKEEEIKQKDLERKRSEAEKLAKAEAVRIAKQKAEQERLKQEEEKRIAQEKKYIEERQAMAKAAGFDSVEAYEADIRKREQEEQERRQIQHALQYPFTAVISCGRGDGENLNVLACFIDGSTSSELRVVSNGQTHVYKVYNMGDAGNLYQDGLHIDLTSSFSISAKNVSSILVLELKILNADGNVVHQDQAGSYQTIGVTN